MMHLVNVLNLMQQADWVWRGTHHALRTPKVISTGLPLRSTSCQHTSVEDSGHVFLS